MISTKKRSAKFVQNKLKKSPSANVDLRETLKDTTTQEMIRLSSLQLRRRKNTRYARSLNPESQEDQNAKHHFRKAQKKIAGCADRWVKDADFLQGIQENSRTYETMESSETVAKKASAIWEPM